MLRGLIRHRTRAVVWSASMLIVAMFGLPGSAGDARAKGEVRTLTIFYIHTKETTSVTFKKDGEYLPEGLKDLNYVFRDWRRDEPTKMDPELFDLIWEIYTDLGSQKPIHLVSGYRSRKTNNRLRRTRGGQAKNSRHIEACRSTSPISPLG